MFSAKKVLCWEVMDFVILPSANANFILEIFVIFVNNLMVKIIISVKFNVDFSVIKVNIRIYNVSSHNDDYSNN